MDIPVGVGQLTVDILKIHKIPVLDEILQAHALIAQVIFNVELQIASALPRKVRRQVGTACGYPHAVVKMYVVVMAPVIYSGGV